MLLNSQALVSVFGNTPHMTELMNLVAIFPFEYHRKVRKRGYVVVLLEDELVQQLSYPQHPIVTTPSVQKTGHQNTFHIFVKY